MSSTCSRAFTLILSVLLLQLSIGNVYVSAFSTASYDVFNTPNSIGQQRVITILVEFKDLKHQTAKNNLEEESTETSTGTLRKSPITPHGSLVT